MSPGLIIAGVAGAVLLVVTLADVFVTIFNYDGFTFLGTRFHPLLWRALRVNASRLPAQPRIFAALGDLIELTRWGLPAGQPLTRHPYLLALADEYTTTVRRLQRSFVGPADDTPPAPLPEEDFWADFCRDRPAGQSVFAFRSLWDEARLASGHDSRPQSPAAQTYQRYRQWLAFHHRRRTFIDRVTVALGYPRPRPAEHPGRAGASPRTSGDRGTAARHNARLPWVTETHDRQRGNRAAGDASAGCRGSARTGTIAGAAFPAEVRPRGGRSHRCRPGRGGRTGPVAAQPG